MNVKVNELKGKLAKSERRTMMFAVICGDDHFVSKVIGWEPKSTYEALDQWKDSWKDTTDDEVLGDIANNAIVALQNSQHGKDSLERAKRFLESFTSLTFESKDDLDKDDYCNAVVQLRLLGPLVLGPDKLTDSSESRKNGNKVKNFKPKMANKKPEPTAEPEEVKTLFMKELENAQMSNDKADTEEGKKQLAENEKSSASIVLDQIKSDDELSKLVCSYGEKFSNWVCEQMYHLEPQVVEVISTITNTKETAKKLFNHYVMWLKNSDPNDYLKYLAESTVDEDNSVIVIPPTVEDSDKDQKVTENGTPTVDDITEADDVDEGELAAIDFITYDDDVVYSSFAEKKAEYDRIMREFEANRRTVNS